MMGNYPNPSPKGHTMGKTDNIRTISKGKTVGDTKKMRKVSKGKSLQRKDVHKATPRSGTMTAVNKVDSGTRLQKIFRQLVQRKMANRAAGNVANPSMMPQGPGPGLTSGGY